MDIIKQLFLQLILILLNAFFAATEIAVISLNEKKVKAQAEDGDKKAVKMLKMIEEPTRFLSTIQIGITLAGFLGSAFAADNFAGRLSSSIAGKFELTAGQAHAINTVSVILITLILSFFTLVFGELVPKRIAMRNKEKLAERVCGVISFLAVLLKPVIWLLTVSTNGILRLIGIDPKAKETPVSEEDIVLMLDAGADEGALNQSDIEYIKNVFNFAGLTAENVMTPRRSVVLVRSDATEEEILRVIETEGYSRIPVIGESEDDVVGILHTRDFLLKRGTPDFRLADILQKPVFVPETVHLDVLFKEMQTHHNHLVVAVNEHGEVAGIVTMEDVIEEIVGEIWDERDEVVENIVRLEENTYRVLCTTPIADFFEFFSIEPEEETEVTTVNGWLMELTGGIQGVGYTFDYGDLTITVTKADEVMMQEISVKIRKKELPAQDSEESSENVGKA